MADILAALEELEAKDPKTKKKNFKPTNTKFRNPLTNQQFVSSLKHMLCLKLLTDTSIQTPTGRTHARSPNLSLPSIHGPTTNGIQH